MKRVFVTGATGLVGHTGTGARKRQDAKMKGENHE